MPQWSKVITTTPSKLAHEINQCVKDLVLLVDNQLANTVVEADALIKAATPVQTSNLVNSWKTVKENAAKIGATVRSYVTYNDAKSYDPGGNNEEYAHLVELGLKSSTRPERRYPAFMLTNRINPIVDRLEKNVGNIS